MAGIGDEWTGKWPCHAVSLHTIGGKHTAQGCQRMAVMLVLALQLARLCRHRFFALLLL
jgi:hypothetical protein